MSVSRHYVYTYSYPNGTPFYVGRGVGYRFMRHLYTARGEGKHHNQYVINVTRKILKSGEMPIIKKIAENIDVEFSALVEQEFISKYGRRKTGGILVNLTDGGEGIVGWEHKQSTRKLLSEKAKSRPSSRIGKLHSDESKKKMSLSHIGHPSSDKCKEAARKTMLKVNSTVRTCTKCGKTGTGNMMLRRHFENCRGNNEHRAWGYTNEGKRVHLGRFGSKEEAVAARNKFYELRDMEQSCRLN